MSVRLTHLNRIQKLTLVGTCLFLIVLAHAHRPTVSESPEARVARRYQSHVSLIKPALPIKLENEQGEVKTLSSYKGQVVLLNFWASWCPPCLKEMPDLERLARDMKGRPFKMIALSADDSWAPIQQVFGNQDLTLEVYRDPSSQNKQHLQYGTTKLPETYVIDKEGRLRLRFINVQPWDDPEIKGYLDWLADQ